MQATVETPATVYQQGSGVANSIDRAKAGMPTTKRQHNWNKGYLQQQEQKDPKNFLLT